MPPHPRRAILVASCDPKFADIRRRVLENAGFFVILAYDSESVSRTCQQQNISLVMLGYSLAPADKRRIWRAAREHCRVPILELYRKGEPEIVDQNVHYHESQTPDDFIETVKRLAASLPS